MLYSYFMLISKEKSVKSLLTSSQPVHYLTVGKNYWSNVEWQMLNFFIYFISRKSLSILLAYSFVDFKCRKKKLEFF